jgi:hypothetical protein
VTLIFLRQHCCSCIQLFYIVFDTMPNKPRSRSLLLLSDFCGGPKLPWCDANDPLEVHRTPTAGIFVPKRDLTR